MGNEGEVIVVVTSSHAPGQGGPPVTVGLRRITLAGEIDPSFGLGTPSVAPPIGGQIVGLFSPPGASASDYSAYTTYRIGGICWLDGTLYVVGTGFSGGATEVNELFDGSVIIVEHPVYNYLVLTQWSGAGLRDTTDPAAVQELGANPCLYWYATGVQQESPTTLIAFGGGGTRWDRTVTVAGHTYTDSSSRTPGPALFRISHPQGLDTTFGDGGIAVIPVLDLNPSVFAGYLHGRTQCTLAFADLTSYKTRTVTGLERFRSSLGGAVRFV